MTIFPQPGRTFAPRDALPSVLLVMAVSVDEFKVVNRDIFTITLVMNLEKIKTKSAVCAVTILIAHQKVNDVLVHLAVVSPAILFLRSCFHNYPSVNACVASHAIGSSTQASQETIPSTASKNCCAPSVRSGVSIS